jgi:hypothetical protein
MTEQRSPKDVMRAALFNRELERARHEQPLGVGPASLLLRTALAVVYMYLIMASYLMMGIIGPVFVSILFVVAFFVPFLYQRATQAWGRRLSRADSAKSSQPQTGSPAQR